MCNQVFMVSDFAEAERHYTHCGNDVQDFFGAGHEVYMAASEDHYGKSDGRGRRGPDDPWKLQAIVDTACTRAVAGHEWFEQYWASRVHTSRFSVDAWLATGASGSSSTLPLFHAGCLSCSAGLSSPSSTPPTTLEADGRSSFPEVVWHADGNRPFGTSSFTCFGVLEEGSHLWKASLASKWHGVRARAHT